MKEERKEFALIEGNILESPIFTLSDKNIGKKAEYQWQHKNKLGNVIEKEKISIEAPKGLPISFDQDVFNAIMKIYNYQKETGEYNKKEVHFTDYEIAKVLQIHFSGERLKRIRESYNRMVHTTIAFEKSFLESGEKITRVVHLLANVEHYEKKKGDREINITKVILDDILINSIERRYFKLIDFKKYIALPSGLPRRLYEYLEKKKYQKSYFEIGIRKLAQRIPLKTKKMGEIKKVLDKANEKLKEQKIIDRWKYKGDNIVYYFLKSERFKEVEKDLFYLENLARTFYESIGVKKISSAQISNGQVVLQNLIDEGYTRDEVEFSLKWTVDNIPDVHSIGILPHTIAQALGDKESQDKIEKMKKLQQQEEQREQEEIKKELELDKKLGEKLKKLPKKEQEEIETLAKQNFTKKFPNLEPTERSLRFERNSIMRKLKQVGIQNRAGKEFDSKKQ